MEVSKILCDCCFREFAPPEKQNWNEAPCTVQFHMGRPAQEGESVKLEHVCLPCRTELRKNFGETVKKLKPSC